MPTPESVAGVRRPVGLRWLIPHALVWTLAAWLSRGNLDVSGDMVENYVWGIEWRAGYAKHPPLFAWITAAWFSVMPRVDWAYFALSALNASVGLAGVAALAQRFLPREDAAVAALALAVSPLYTALAIKFNANAVLLSVWPWAAYCFVAFMQRGRLWHAAACGALVAVALLGKYFSVVLALALAVCAVAIPAWRQRLRGAGPWVALACGVAALAPHLAWLFDQQFLTLRYASQRSEGQLDEALLRLANYSVAQVGYMLPSAVLLWWSVNSADRRAAARQMLGGVLRPSVHPELWWLAFAPMIMIAVIAAVAKAPMASVWGMAQWFALPALWLAALGHDGTKLRATWPRRALPAYWGVVLALAAAVGYAEARDASRGAVEPRFELAHAAHTLWYERTGRALPIVAGSAATAMSVAFYAPGKTRWWSPTAPTTTPWITAADWQREGGLLICDADDVACQQAAPEFAATPGTEVTVHKRAWGLVLPPSSYRLYLRLPS